MADELQAAVVAPMSTLNDFMDDLEWSPDYRRGVMSAWPEIERLRSVLRMIRDMDVTGDPPQSLARKMRDLSLHGLRGE